MFINRAWHSMLSLPFEHSLILTFLPPVETLGLKGQALQNKSCEVLKRVFKTSHLVPSCSSCKICNNCPLSYFHSFLSFLRAGIVSLSFITITLSARSVFTPWKALTVFAGWIISESIHLDSTEWVAFNIPRRHWLWINTDACHFISPTTGSDFNSSGGGYTSFSCILSLLIQKTDASKKIS